MSCYVVEIVITSSKNKLHAGACFGNKLHDGACEQCDGACKQFFGACKQWFSGGTGLLAAGRSIVPLLAKILLRFALKAHI